MRTPLQRAQMRGSSALIGSLSTNTRFVLSVVGFAFNLGYNKLLIPANRRQLI